MAVCLLPLKWEEFPRISLFSTNYVLSKLVLFLCMRLLFFFCFFLSKTILYIEKLKKKQKKQETKKPKNHVSSENFLLDKFSLEFLFSSLDTLISNSSIEAFYFQYKVWQNWP